MKAFALAAAVLLSTSLAGCIVVPSGHGYRGGGGGVAYVAPAYAMPAPGFAWEYHARFGWGWRHPQRGWHRGWQ